MANSIAWMARNLSFDGCYMSPFAKSARQNGIDAIGQYFNRRMKRAKSLYVPTERFKENDILVNTYILLVFVLTVVSYDVIQCVSRHVSCV